MTTDEPLDIDLAIDMAHAIQRFRQEPTLARSVTLRSSDGFNDMVEAWDAFVARYPHARLTKATMQPEPNARRASVP